MTNYTGDVLLRALFQLRRESPPPKESTIVKRKLVDEVL
jgi:hypothetical protein